MDLPARKFAAGIAYRDHDGTSGSDHDAVQPAVICLHGIGGDDTSFADQFGELGTRRVIAWNMPGYAGSSMMREMDFPGLAGAVTRLMDALQIDNAHIVGQSIGGMIAQEVAIQSPERVASLGLIATVPAFGGRDDSFKTAFLKARLAPLDAGQTMADIAADAMAIIMGPAAPESARQAANRAMAAIDPDAYRQVLSCLVTFNRRAEQHLLTMPCCLIAGALDDNSPARTMEKMAEQLPDAAFHIIENAGHMVNAEKPEEVNAILTAFFNRLA